MIKKEILLVILVANVFITYAQTPELTKKDSTIVSSWIAGIGFNAVDDSGDQFNRLFDIKDSWNAVPYPSRLSIGRYFKNGLGIEAIASYNKYKKDKIIDGLPIANDQDYFSIDSRLSYDLNKIIGETGWFDPYVGVGIGYANVNDISRGTYNGVLGFRTWFSDRIGLDVNSSGKWAMNSNATNHLQHAVGVVYRFNIEKELNEEGEAKLELIEALEKEAARVNDSIALANENKLLAERLEREKEAARLAQLEKEKEEARAKEKSDIKNKIDALEKVYFALNSSTLSSSSKNTLSGLTLILNEHPKLQLEISSHTDSRGSAVYNQGLSERRLKSTIDYLLNNGVGTDRVIGKAYGEEKLINECDDNTKCSEIKHKENRRSEFEIVNY
ncbi:OmpA family protein [Confluentibacter citreus]|uniref:OmpA family protein n=1 Tax=Confluentibacter citreus TaxID=2007307 RepID=UPI000C283A2F|nr:OmpA family protein [Confluentibacter citreus]